jgi:hypothetical protein
MGAVADRPRLSFLGELPPSGPARAAVIAALVVGGVVALLVPIFFVVILLGILRG